MENYKRFKMHNRVGGASYKRCILQNVEFPRDEMVRFVVGPDKEIFADIKANLPGRGFWLSARRDVINTARVKNVFARVARDKVKVSDDLVEQVEKLHVRRCQDIIGMARRSGQAISGFTKVEAWLKSGKPTGVLFAAADGKQIGKKKIGTWAREAPTVETLSAYELGAAFSRDRLVHAILAPGRLASDLLATVRRLEGLRVSL